MSGSSADLESFVDFSKNLFSFFVLLRLSDFSWLLGGSRDSLKGLARAVWFHSIIISCR